MTAKGHGRKSPLKIPDIRASNDLRARWYRWLGPHRGKGDALEAIGAPRLAKWANEGVIPEYHARNMERQIAGTYA